MTRFAWLIAVATIVAGCTGQTGGSPAAERAPGEYRAALADDERAQLDYFESVQGLDPCALLPDSAIAAIGVPTTFGNGIKPSECVVEFDRGAGPKGIRTVKVEIAPGNIAVAEGNSATTIGGKPANVHMLSSDNCVAYVNVGEYVNLQYTSSTAGDVDSCPELQAVIEAAIPVFATTPLKAVSAHWHSTRLDDVAPCGVLGALTVGDEPYVYAGADTCSFALDGGPQGTRFAIAHLYYPPSTLSVSSDTKLDILGVPATESAGSSCVIRIGVGSADPFPDPHDPAAQLIDVITLQGDPGVGCDVVRRTAAEVVRLYQAA